MCSKRVKKRSRRKMECCLHHGAGVAARLAAVPHQEGAVPLPSQQRLRLAAVDVSEAPQTLVVMRKVLLILHHAVLAERAETEDCEEAALLEYFYFLLRLRAACTVGAGAPLCDL